MLTYGAIKDLTCHVHSWQYLRIISKKVVHQTLINLKVISDDEVRFWIWNKKT